MNMISIKPKIKEECEKAGEYIFYLKSNKADHNAACNIKIVMNPIVNIVMIYKLYRVMNFLF